MADESTLEMFSEPMDEKRPTTSYLLTGVRQLLRMLDIGLVVPELVACKDDQFALFDAADLPALHGIEGYPGVPVLLELQADAGVDSKAYPASVIKTIHFASAEALEDYLARGFENVPNGLFEFSATPDLFEQGEARGLSARLGKLDRSALKERYRPHDVLAGLLRACIKVAAQPTDLQDLLESMASHSGVDDIHAAFNSWVQLCEAADLLKAGNTEVLGNYLEVLSERDIDEGWVSAEVLETLVSRLPGPLAGQDSFREWHRYSNAVISNEKDLQALTDEGDVSLRAMLLHLLNPDGEAIERMAQRDPAPGPRVLAMASILAATRLGFAPLDAADKQGFPGAYFLVCDLIAAFINKQPFDFGALQQVADSAGAVVMTWQGATVHHFATTQEEGESAGDIHEDSGFYLSLTDLELMAKGLTEVESTAIDDGQLTLTLSKLAAKLLPRQASFSLKLTEKAVLFSSRLLDLSVKSQKAKLTGKRALAALAWQTAQGNDFRFLTAEDDCFSAEIELARPVDGQVLQAALQRLMECHAWIKKPIK